MKPAASIPLRTQYEGETANDRFKRRSVLWQSHALILAVVLHFALLVSWPTMTSGVVERNAEELQIIAPPEVDIPPAPEQLARPAVPVIGAPDLPDDATIPRTEWTPRPADRLAPPSTTQTRERGDFEQFTPAMIAPRVLNQAEVERALVRHYPPLLRDAGIGGQVEVQLWLDEQGGIVKAELSRTSGHAALDEAAMKVIDVMRLSPALNRDRPARVIVTIPIVFRAS